MKKCSMCHYPNSTIADRCFKCGNTQFTTNVPWYKGQWCKNLCAMDKTDKVGGTQMSDKCDYCGHEESSKFSLILNKCPLCGIVICNRCNVSGNCPECNSLLEANNKYGMSRDLLDIKRGDVGTSFLSNLTALLILAGAGIIIYYMFFFDTSVAVPGAESLGIESGRVNNIGLLADKQNGILCGFGLAFFGVIAAIYIDFKGKYNPAP